MIKKAIYYIKKEIILSLSIVAAIFSMIFVPPSIAYLSYIDFKVLAILFCLMTVVAGFIKLNVFEIITSKLMLKSKNTKDIAIILIHCCFFSAMLVTNDVALLTFIPLTLGIFSNSRQQTLIFVIVTETIAANLGSIIMPIGNPQNLYIYSYYNMNIDEFIKIVFPIGAVSYFLIMGLTLFIKKEPISIPNTQLTLAYHKLKVLIFIGLFLICILTVLNFIDYKLCFAIIIIIVILTYREILHKVDYSLIFTFVAFFIFVGNLSNIEFIKHTLSHIIYGREFILSVLISQAVSNVPAAIMLSNFTDNSRDLLLGVNIGGLGTLIASLASLISYKFYSRSENSKPLKYLAVFTVLNFLILFILLSVCLLKIFH